MFLYGSIRLNVPLILDRERPIRRGTNGQIYFSYLVVKIFFHRSQKLFFIGRENISIDCENISIDRKNIFSSVTKISSRRGTYGQTYLSYSVAKIIFHESLKSRIRNN